VRRRDFIAALGVATWPIAAIAQQVDRVRRIGIVMGYEESNPYAQAQVTAFRQQLHKFGWVEGSNIQIDIRYAGADLDRARVVGRELVALGPDVVVANTNLVTTVLQSEVRTIPLLFIGVSDPVGSGFVSDLAHPSGNATGFAIFLPSIGGKWLQLLLEAVPQSERIGLVFHPEPQHRIPESR
jgi:putative ABC transport system substrate-binding protein